MNRKEKIEYIKKNFSDLYNRLKRNVPKILDEPDNATAKDIHIYNQFIVWQAGFLEDASLLKKLSF